MACRLKPSKHSKLFPLRSEAAPHQSRRPHARPFGGYLKVNSSETLSIFGNKCPHNCSKNDLMAPRTTLGYPHERPSVDFPTSVIDESTRPMAPMPGMRHLVGRLVHCARCAEPLSVCPIPANPLFRSCAIRSAIVVYSGILGDLRF